MDTIAPLWLWLFFGAAVLAAFMGGFIQGCKCAS